MNVLEKILEEIEKAENEYCHEEHSPMFCMGACSMAADVKGIIRSHMDEVPGVQIEEIKKINQEMEEYLFEKYNVEGYDEKLDEIFTRYLSICKNVNFSNWIPVSERLPEMPEENPILDNKPLEIYIVDIGEHYPFRAFWNGKNFTDGWNILKVIAWKPLPEPYKEEEYE